MAVILIAIGLLFTGVDVPVLFGIGYPEFVMSQGQVHGVDIHPKIRQYVTENILGSELQIDILPDVLGCVLILLGAIMLIRHNKSFFQVIILAIVSGACSVVLRVLPFFVNGGERIVSALAIFFFSFVFEIWMEYKAIYLIVNVSDDMANVSTNRRMQFGWWVTAFSRIFIFLLTFVGIMSVRRVYEAVVLFFTLFYLYQLLQTRKYVGTYRIYKEGFNSAIVPAYIREKTVKETGCDSPDVSWDNFRYVRFLHYDLQGQVQEGELVVNKKIAHSVMRVFYRLYKWEYPIESVYPVDNREGMAIEINPGMEQKKDIAYKIFKYNGFSRSDDGDGGKPGYYFKR